LLADGAGLAIAALRELAPFALIGVERLRERVQDGADDRLLARIEIDLRFFTRRLELVDRGMALFNAPAPGPHSTGPQHRDTILVKQRGEGRFLLSIFRRAGLSLLVCGDSTAD
jgi:hypothetical protein